MAKTDKKSEKAEIDWPPCQLMLVIEPGAGARARLEAALAVSQVAAVLVRPKTGDRLGAGEVKPLVDAAQAAGAAALVFEDALLAKTLKADGVHLPMGLDVSRRVEDARAEIGQDATVGVDAGHSRHAAMDAGDAGADYVGFGAGDGSVGALAARDDLIAWWADIFEVPCVALDVAAIEDAEKLARDGADFVALILPAQGAPEVAAQLSGDVDAMLMRAADTAAAE